MDIFTNEYINLHNNIIPHIYSYLTNVGARRFVAPVVNDNIQVINHLHMLARTGVMIIKVQSTSFILTLIGNVKS